MADAEQCCIDGSPVKVKCFICCGKIPMRDPLLSGRRKYLGGSRFDFLFIDGDHTYEGVEKDWEMYSSVVRPGGIIAFHDFAGNYDDTQVKRLWDSIKPKFEYREYVVDPGGQYGIGVLVK